MGFLFFGSQRKMTPISKRLLTTSGFSSSFVDCDNTWPCYFTTPTTQFQHPTASYRPPTPTPAFLHPTSSITMGLDDVSYGTISKVINTWEQSRQRFACSEEMGIEILLNLFRLDPTTKAVFGFKEGQDLDLAMTSNPLIRMGVLVHAANIVKSIDAVIALLGPDVDTLEVLLAEIGLKHKRMGILPSQVSFMGDACREALAEIIPTTLWSTDMDKAWRELFRELTDAMVKSMV